MDASILKNAVARYIEAFDKGDTGIIAELFAADATVEDPVGSPVRRGLDEIKAFYQSSFDMGVKLVLVGKPRCAGNSVAFSFEAVVGNMRISPIDVFELDDSGRVKSMRAYWNEENMG